VPKAAEPGGFQGLGYFRLHGSPRPYYSRYAEEFVKQIANRLEKLPRVWCIFDNTAAGWAFENALQLTKELGIERKAAGNAAPSEGSLSATHR
jgi:uncharacterized protein YecE (DUF72 family)